MDAYTVRMSNGDNSIPTGSNVSVQGDVGTWAGLGNQLSGNVDYARQLELLGLQNQFTAEQNAKMMAFNADEAKKAREWQEMMSNTAYSRAMADAKKAGINPALIFSQGGATTPTSSSAYANANGASGVGSRGNSAALASVIGAIFGAANTALKVFGTKLN